MSEPAQVASLRARVTDPDRRVRLAAIAEISATRDSHGSEAARLLDVALDDSHPLVRLRAVDALGRLGSPQALGVLLARMDDPTAPTLLRRMAFQAVVEIGTLEAADALEARMGDYSPGRGQRVVARKIAKMRSGH